MSLKAVVISGSLELSREVRRNLIVWGLEATLRKFELRVEISKSQLAEVPNTCGIFKDTFGSVTLRYKVAEVCVV